MTRTLLNLANSLEKRAANIEAEASRAACEVTEAILTDLVTKTPVDTSRAVSNWQVSLNAKIPLDGKIEPYFMGLAGSTHLESASAAIDAGLAVLKKKKPGDTIYLSNVLPYINRLNEGYSKQAPAGFVERSVMIGRNIMKRFKIKLKG